MTIDEVTENKKIYLPLLLLADEQEDMIDRYLASGRMFRLWDNGVKCIAVVTRLNETECELKIWRPARQIRVTMAARCWLILQRRF